MLTVQNQPPRQKNNRGGSGEQGAVLRQGRTCGDGRWRRVGKKTGEAAGAGGHSLRAGSEAGVGAQELCWERAGQNQSDSSSLAAAAGPPPLPPRRGQTARRAPSSRGRGAAPGCLAARVLAPGSRPPRRALGRARTRPGSVSCAPACAAGAAVVRLCARELQPGRSCRPGGRRADCLPASQPARPPELRCSRGHGALAPARHLPAARACGRPRAAAAHARARRVLKLPLSPARALIGARCFLAVPEPPKPCNLSGRAWRAGSGWHTPRWPSIGPCAAEQRSTAPARWELGAAAGAPSPSGSSRRRRGTEAAWSRRP